MKPLGQTKTPTKVEKHQHCSICHPEHKGGRAKENREAEKQQLKDDMDIGINAAKALKAKKILLEKLKGQEWLRGIGIAGEPGEYYIKVNISEKLEDILVVIPEVVNGIKVVVEVVGKIKPLEKK